MRGAHISALGKAVSDPSRAEILCVLARGAPRTAGQLAAHVGLAASTTSRHLSVLLDAGLVKVEPAGRHRYFKVRSPGVTDLLRRMDEMDVPADPVRSQRRANEITLARTCYDHLAGDIGIQLFQSMIEMSWIELVGDGTPQLTALGHVKLQALDIDTQFLGQQRRPMLRGCLDWEHHARHLGGGIGSALLAMMIHHRWLTRRREQRVIAVTPFGARQLSDHFNVDVA